MEGKKHSCVFQFKAHPRYLDSWTPFQEMQNAKYFWKAIKKAKTAKESLDFMI